ncbi:MAG: D-glycero-beta-D-manno-heptose 1-phosphate adenylyltransferase [Candidatus Omnitrophota bacterium]
MIKVKIKSQNQLKEILNKLRIRGKTIVFTNGCFDLLHYGHVKCLEEAKKLGDYLIVAVNSDSSVRRLKGKNRPITPEASRARIIAALESVDFVTIFNEDTPLNLIKKIRPDVLVKGADWKVKNIVGRDVLANYGARISTVPLVKGYSTTEFIKKIAKSFFR